MALTIWAIFFLGTITERVLRDTGTDLWPCAANKTIFPLSGFCGGIRPAAIFTSSNRLPCPTLEIVVIVSIHLVSLYFAGRALLAKRGPAFRALGWTAALVFMPVIGLLLYLLLA